MKSSAISTSIHISEPIHRILAWGGLLIAFSLRLHRLGVESLWYDETVSAYMARQPLAEMVAHTARDIHPPGYYALLHLWSSLTAPFGSPQMEYILAYPSLWFGVLSIALLVPIGRTLLGAAPATLAVWLAALSPFLLWYAQEVRMYTVAAALGLLCLVAAIRFVQRTLAQPTDRTSSAIRWIVVYVVFAATGLYILYYFAFGLLAVNLAVFATLLSPPLQGRRIGRVLAMWLLAQLAVLLLLLPWLPILAKQALDPPVPPWRLPWESVGAVMSSIAASLSAYLVGQTVPEAQQWFWAVTVLVLLIAYFDYTKFLLPIGTISSRHIFTLWLPLYAFVPTLLIFVLSLLVTPLYHVRYLSSYAPTFPLIAAAGLIALYRRRRAAFALMLTIVLAGSAYSMSRFWRYPEYRPDDHRAAVADLAKLWRPGDAILVNAGWVYTALDSYWPTRIGDPYAAIPPSPIHWTRLTNVLSTPPAEELTDRSEVTQNPVGTLSGNVNGSPSLGWGSPDADFYAISDEDTIAALDTLASHTNRIWHYRLYDTVNDPDSIIRNWLSDSLPQTSEAAFSGPGYLKLEQYEGEGQPYSDVETANDIVFEGRLTMRTGSLPQSVPAGSYLYVPVKWTPLPAFTAGSGLAVSLRLSDEDGRLWAQQDVAIPDLIAHGLSHRPNTQVLALPISAATPPGAYELQLVIYHADTLEPLASNTDSDQSDADSSSLVSLGTVQVGLPVAPILRSKPLTHFDYLELIAANLPSSLNRDAENLHVDLVWRPAPSDYTDVYSVRLSLIDEENSIVASWEEPIGPAQYPSSQWAERLPVRDQLDLLLPEDLLPGDYRVRMNVIRSSDGLTIPSRRLAWLPVTRSDYEVGTFTLRP